jgi:hypothetical protein
MAILQWDIDHKFSQLVSGHYIEASSQPWPVIERRRRIEHQQGLRGVYCLACSVFSDSR